jgi:hypothetical protein
MGGGTADEDIGLTERFGRYLWEAFEFEDGIKISSFGSGPILESELIAEETIILPISYGSIYISNFKYLVHEKAPEESK